MFLNITKPSQIQAICKHACVFVFTLVLTNVATAQIASTTKTKNHPGKFLESLEVGIAGGFSLNRFTKEQPQTGFNTGYTAGLLVNYKIVKGISFQLEFNSLQQGGQLIRFKDDTRFEIPESFDSKNVKNSSYRLNSIEIPLLINYTFKLKQAWKPSLYAGGSYAYTYNVSENYQKTGDLLPGEDIMATVSGSQNVTDLFNRTRFNLIVGANIKLPLAERLMLILDFRYLNGISPARADYSYMDKIGFGTNIRTNSFISKIGISMPLNRK